MTRIDLDGTALDFEKSEAARDVVVYPDEHETGYQCKACGRNLTEYPDHFRAEDGGAWVTECPDAEPVDDEGSTLGPHVAEPVTFSWLNHAGVELNDERDGVTVHVSVGDPQGAFALTVHRVNDPEHENYGKLILTMPYAGEPGLRAPLRQIANGGYIIEDW